MQSDMKGPINILMSLSLLLMLSCSREDAPVDMAQEAILFASPGIETRALVNDLYEMEDGFSVYASRYTQAYMDAGFFNNVKVSRAGEYEGEYFWTPGASHEFFSVYPYYDEVSDEYDDGLEYEMDGTGKTLKVIGSGSNGELYSGTDNNGQNLLKDILYDVALYEAPFIPGQSDFGKIKFNLKHACSAISFSINNLYGENISSVSLTSGNIEITGLDDTGLLAISADGGISAKWEGLADSQEKHLYLPSVTVIGTDVWKHGEERDWHTAVIIPQDFTSKTVSLSFDINFANNDRRQYAVTLSDVKVGGGNYKYLPGKHYKYRFDITNTNIMCYVTIVDWIEDEPIKLQ